MSPRKNPPELYQDQRPLGAPGELRETVQKMSADIGEIKDTLQDLLKAFPAGDLEGHRRYHDAMIERNHEIRKLRYAIREKTIFGLLWLALGLIGTSLWFFISAKLMTHPGAPTP